MKLVIISGLSGSGKTVALHTLEDEGFYCVDNLPLGLLPGFTEQIMKNQIQIYDEVAVGIDARSGVNDLRNFDDIMNRVRTTRIEVEIIFFQGGFQVLQTQLPVVVDRFLHPVLLRVQWLIVRVRAPRPAFCDRSPGT